MNFDKHSRVLELLNAAQVSESDMREHSDECHVHVALPGGQWEQFWWDANSDNPRYTYDVTTPIVDQIASDICEADYSIRVSPLGGSAKKDVAAIYDGIIRNIQMMSGAKKVFNASSKNAVIGGIDGWRVVNKYLTPDSFDQDLSIEEIPDYRRRVWHDPASLSDDKADARWCVVLHSPLLDDYKERWPKGSAQSLPTVVAASGLMSSTKDIVIIGELLYAKEVSVEIVQMTNGKVYKADEKFKSISDELARAGVLVSKRRKIKENRWYSRFFDQSDWLEDAKETPFKSCPVIPEYANYTVVEDQQVYRGEVSRLLDPARNLNYTLSREMAEGALAPRAKYWMTLLQASGGKIVTDGLETLNTNNNPVQFYTNDPQIPGPPQQQGGAQVNPGLRTMSEAMLAIVGHVANRFQAAMGNNPGLQSGVAIDKLQDKSNMAGFKYLQSHSSALCRTGRVLVEAIPTVYDSNNRAVRILNEDGTQETITINETIIDEQTGQPIVINDLSQGVYDVVCEAGASFKNRQDQTIAFILEMSRSDQTILPMGGDLLINSLGFPAAKQLAERKRAQMLQQGIIPPSQMTDEEKAQAEQSAQNKPQDPAAILAMAEMEKAKAENILAQVKMAELQLREKEIQLKTLEAQANAQLSQGKQDIDAFNAETKRFDSQVKAEVANANIQLMEVKQEGETLYNAQAIKEIITPRLQ